MKRSSALAATTALVTSLILPGAAANAQTLALEEIVVTARKVEENLMEVPLAITAFSAADLEARDMAQLEDIQLYTPSLSFTNMQGGSGRNDRSRNSLVFRGLQLSVNTGITAGGQVFIDGAPVIGGYNPSIVDVERVEVLKGPQSAYFGRSTFVGAINFVTRDPSDEFSGRIAAEYARFGSREVNASIEGPIVDGKLAGRISARHWKQGGYFDNINDDAELGERRTNSISASFVATPSDNFKAKLFVNYFQDKDGAATQFALKEDQYNGRGNINGGCDAIGSPLPAGFNTATRAQFGTICGTLPSVSELPPEVFTADTVIDPILRETLFNPNPNWLVFDPSFYEEAGLKRNAFQADFRMDYEFDSGVTLTSLTAYHYDKNQNIIDLNYRDFRDRPNPLAGFFIGVLGRTDIRTDYNTTLLIQGKQTDWSQELRLTSAQDQNLRWTLGFNYFDAHSPGGSVYGNLIFGPFFTAAIIERDVKTPAVFGAAYYDITNELTLSVEARYQWDKITENTLIATTGRPPVTPALLSETYKSFSPRVSLDYNYAENSTVYALFSRGYRPGRFNGVFLTSPQDVLDALVAAEPNAALVIEEERLDNYELGLKSTWLDGRVRTTVAAYYNEWKNGQVLNSVPVVTATTANLVSVTTNTGLATLYGLELEGQFQATENLTISGSLGYNHTEVDNYFCGDCNNQYGSLDGVEGNRLPGTPEITWNLSAAYDDELTAEYDWYGRIDWSHQGNRMVDYSNITQTSAYDVVDVRLGIRNDNVKLEAFVKNALNHDEFLQGTLGTDLFFFRGPTTPQQNEIRVSAPIPRTFGVRASYNF